MVYLLQDDGIDNGNFQDKFEKSYLKKQTKRWYSSKRKKNLNTCVRYNQMLTTETVAYLTIQYYVTYETVNKW